MPPARAGGCPLAPSHLAPSSNVFVFSPACNRRPSRAAGGYPTPLPTPPWAPLTPSSGPLAGSRAGPPLLGYPALGLSMSSAPHSCAPLPPPPTPRPAPTGTPSQHQPRSVPHGLSEGRHSGCRPPGQASGPSQPCCLQVPREPLNCQEFYTAAWAGTRVKDKVSREHKHAQFTAWHPLSCLGEGSRRGRLRAGRSLPFLPFGAPQW